ncbi:MAG TPA: phosphoribosyltransferase [Methanofastidiosum sp.]|nr:phosphoribosyltransferase [Methanofastidiosum sp.]
MYISQRKFFKDLRSFAKYFKDIIKDSDCICCISRGGLIMSVYLSHKFNKPLIIAAKEKNRWQFLGDINNYRKFLIVDEICDSGVTIEEVCCSLSTRVSKPALMIPCVLYAKLTDALVFDEGRFWSSIFNMKAFRLVSNRWITFWYEGKQKREKGGKNG